MEDVVIGIIIIETIVVISILIIVGIKALETPPRLSGKFCNINAECITPNRISTVITT